MATANLELLNTWKEIANYLGRGVRTAQRRERHGMPVRRVTPGPRASVLANRRDIDEWIKSAKLQPVKLTGLRDRDAIHTELFENVKESRALRSENAALMASGRRSLLLLLETIRGLEESCHPSVANTTH